MQNGVLIQASKGQNSDGIHKRQPVACDDSGRLAQTIVPTQLTVETLAVVANADPATPVVLSGSAKWFTQAIISGKKDQTTANTGIVYIGGSSTNGENMEEVLPGTPYFISAPAGGALNLADFYMDVATANDGLAITLFKPAETSS